MSTIPKPHFTLEEYFALEKGSERRWEYWDGEIICMSGGSLEHTLICSNVHTLLAVALNGSSCRTFGPEAIDTPVIPPYRYPDASVVCGKPEFRVVSGIGRLVNPVLIIEVESPSTRDADHGPKLNAYKLIPSLCDYLIIAQHNRLVTHHAKRDAVWSKEKIYTAGVIELASIKVALDIDDIYAEVPVPN